MGNCASGPTGDLYDAITNGEARTAVYIVRQNHKLLQKASMPYGRTVWHVAAEAGQLEVLRSLTDYVWASVPYAPQGSRASAFNLARASNQNPSLMSEPPRFARHSAAALPDEIFVPAAAALAPKAAAAHIQTAEQHPLIKRAINDLDFGGSTALMLACVGGHADIAAFLMAQGADPWVRDTAIGKSAMHVAAVNNSPECIHAIMTYPGLQAFKEATDGHSIKVVDLPNLAGYAPLHYAAAAKNLEAAAALFVHGCDPNAKNWEEGHDWFTAPPGSTPLHMCARTGNTDFAVSIMKYYNNHLKQKDVTDPRVVDNMTGQRPYHMPGVKGNKTLERILNPDTPIKEIVDPFAATDGDKKEQPAIQDLPHEELQHALSKGHAPWDYANRTAKSAVAESEVHDTQQQPDGGKNLSHVVQFTASSTYISVSDAAARQMGDFSLPMPAHLERTITARATHHGGGDFNVPKGWEDVHGSRAGETAARFMSVYRSSGFEDSAVSQAVRASYNGGFAARDYRGYGKPRNGNAVVPLADLNGSLQQQTGVNGASSRWGGSSSDMYGYGYSGINGDSHLTTASANCTFIPPSADGLAPPATPSGATAGRLPPNGAQRRSYPSQQTMSNDGRTFSGATTSDSTPGPRPVTAANLLREIFAPGHSVAIRQQANAVDDDEEQGDNGAPLQGPMSDGGGTASAGGGRPQTAALLRSLTMDVLAPGHSRQAAVAAAAASVPAPIMRVQQTAPVPTILVGPHTDVLQAHPQQQQQLPQQQQYGGGGAAAAVAAPRAWSVADYQRHNGGAAARRRPVSEQIIEEDLDENAGGNVVRFNSYAHERAAPVQPYVRPTMITRLGPSFNRGNY